ncbi:MAG: gliding motility lipoprotein GldD [Flavobacteriaceae bacterium]|nr:gliding motility lipoprotein GldD [Flavobacteriaceae bacterium]
MLILCIFESCSKDEAIPKPAGQVRLEYPEPNYVLFRPNCPFEFEFSGQAKVSTKKNNCWYDFYYPRLKGTVYITYLPVNGNLVSLIKESQKLVYEHTIKANSIKAKSFAYPEKKVYGSLYHLGGETASNMQFYITDSTRHFITGNVYFKTQPKPDSLRPAVEYIEKDIVRMIETTIWK